MIQNLNLSGSSFAGRSAALPAASPEVDTEVPLETRVETLFAETEALEGRIASLEAEAGATRPDKESTLLRQVKVREARRTAGDTLAKSVELLESTVLLLDSRVID